MEGIGSNLHDYYTSVARIYIGIFLCYKHLVPPTIKNQLMTIGFFRDGGNMLLSHHIPGSV